jgi:hypothetical protein
MLNGLKTGKPDAWALMRKVTGMPLRDMLTKTAYHLLVHICRVAGDAPYMFESRETMAIAMQVSGSAINRALYLLRDLGLLYWQEVERENRRCMGYFPIEAAIDRWIADVDGDEEKQEPQAPFADDGSWNALFDRRNVLFRSLGRPNKKMSQKPAYLPWVTWVLFHGDHKDRDAARDEIRSRYVPERDGYQPHWLFEVPPPPSEDDDGGYHDQWDVLDIWEGRVVPSPPLAASRR